MKKNILLKLFQTSFVLAMGAMCFTGPLGPSAAAAATAENIISQTAVVTNNQVNLRGGPGTEHALSGQAGAGERMSVVGRTGDWYRVNKSDGNPAWIAGWLVRVESTVAFSPPNPPSPPEPPVEQPAPPDIITPPGNELAVVATAAVNLRGGPGTSYGVVGQANTGDKLPIVDRQGDWLKVEPSTGQTAWIASWLVKVETLAGGGGLEEPTPPDENNWLPGKGDENKPPADKEEPPKNDKNEIGPNDPQLTAIKITEDGDDTTIRIESNTPLKYSSFMLSNPQRLVVDLEDVHLGKTGTTDKVKSQTIKELRSAQFTLEPLVTRLVLDLSGNVEHKIRTAENGRVLIIETTPLKHDQAVHNKLIYIDPGHGGAEPGASGYSGQTLEKDIVLDISLRLADILRDQGFRVEMCRTSDATVGLNQRPYLANEINADIFVSIHANSFINSTPRGTETYFYAPSGNQYLYDQRSDRKRLADSIHKFMVQDLGIPDRGVKESNLAVLRESKMPSVLVETAFINNPEDEKLLRDPSFRQRTAEAIAKGINSYFTVKN